MNKEKLKNQKILEKNKKEIYKLKEENKNKNINDKLSNDKFNVLNEINDNIFKKDNRIISIYGNHGSGKSLIIKKFIKINKKRGINYIKVDVWELFGLRSPYDYHGESKTAYSILNEKQTRRINSYYYETKIVNNVKHYDFATKLNIRKVIWRSIISQILLNKKFNLLFYFKLKNIKKVWQLWRRNIFKILKNNNNNKIDHYKWVIISFCIFGFLFFLTIPVVISLILNDLFLRIISGIPIVSIIIKYWIAKKDYKFKEIININEFLLDESNFLLIKEWIKLNIKNKKLFIHVDEIDRLLSWLNNNVIDSSLIHDIINTLYFMYKIENVHILIEMNDKVWKKVGQGLDKNGDIVKKMCGELIKVKSISQDDIEEHYKTKENSELNEIEKLFAKEYYETFEQKWPNKLSYRLLKKYINNFKEMLENRKDLKEENKDFWEPGAYKEIIQFFLYSVDDYKKPIKNLNSKEKIKEEIDTTYNGPKFSWTKGMWLYNYDYTIEMISNIFKWMNGKIILNHQNNDLQYDYSRFINFDYPKNSFISHIIEENNSKFNKIKFKKGLKLSNWIREKYLYHTNNDGYNKRNNLFFNILINFLEKNNYNIEIHKSNFSIYFVETIITKINQSQKLTNEKKLYFASQLKNYDVEQTRELVKDLDPRQLGEEYFKKNYKIFSYKKEYKKYAKENNINIDKNWTINK